MGKKKSTMDNVDAVLENYNVKVSKGLGTIKTFDERKQELIEEGKKKGFITYE